MSVNLLAFEAPQLISAAGIVVQHDGGIIITTSERSNFSVAPQFDPADAILMTINDNSCADELVAFLGFRDNVPYGAVASNDIP